MRRNDHGPRRSVAPFLLAGLIALVGCRRQPERAVGPQAQQAERWVAQLRDGQPLEREQAAVELARIFNPFVLKPLVEAARSDTAMRVRVAALRSLGEHKELADRAALVALLRDSEEAIRLGACDALARLNAVEGIDALVARTGDSSASVRTAAIQALGRLGPKARDKLAEVFQSANEGQRAAIVEAFADANASHGVPLVIEALTGETVHLRRTAAKALGRLGDARAVGPLVALVRNPLSDFEKRRYEAEADKPLTERERRMVLRAQAMATIKKGFRPDDTKLPAADDPRTRADYRQIIAAQRGNVERMVRQTAVAALLRVGTPAACEALLGLLGDAGAGAREAAGEGLLSLGSAAVAPLRAALLDAARPPEARVTAGELLVKADPNAARPALVTCLDDKLATVRSLAAGVLADMGAKEAVEPLIRQLRSGDAEVRSAAAEALAKVADARAVEPLLAVLGDADLRPNAIAALGATGDPRAAKALLAIVLDPNAPLRIGALQAMEKMNYPPAHKPLFDLYVWMDRHPPAPPARQPTTADSESYRYFQRLKGELMRSFGAMRNTEAVPLLVGIVNDFATQRTGPDHRAIVGWGEAGQVMQALGKIGDRRAVQPIAEALRRPKLHRVKIGINYTAETCIEAMASIGDPSAIDALLATARDSARLVNTRTAALRAVARIGGAKATEALIGLLADETLDPGLKEAGVAPALLAIGQPATDGLLKLMLDSPAKTDASQTDPGYYAAELLGALAKGALIDRLVGTAQSDKRKHIVGRAVEALRGTNDPRAVAQLAAMLKAPDAVVRKWAAGALGRSPAGGAEQMLAKALGGEKDPDVRQAIEWAIETQRRRGQEFVP